MAASAYVTRKPTGCPGSATPKASRPTVRIPAVAGWGQQTQARGALIASLQERARRAEAEQGRRIAEARASERTRIAREMHDVLAHRLSLLATYAGAIEYRPDAPPDQVARAAGVVRDGAHQALDELREVITVLRDDDGDGDAVQRPQPGLADLPRLVEESRDAGACVQLDDRIPGRAAVPGAAERVPGAAERPRTGSSRRA
jgi:signal transduction histidine kinase